MKRHVKAPESGRAELLAPAGTHEAFMAAIEAGADAIYVSPRILNARAYGRNFTMRQIADLRQTASKHGVKLFAALNSLMKERETASCISLLAQFEAIGIDAIIVQDLGIARIARKHFPSLRLHASTLMTVHNSSGADACRRLGFSRVVLARELTMKEIGLICRKSPIETEVFVHGAMCFSMSGLCRFSSFFGGRSSTRGRCVQPCRRLYHWAGRRGTFFSMDDLCAIELLPALVRSGVSSLKIEGRLKPPGYVYHVVKAYRMILDAGRAPSNEIMERALDEISKALGRPLTTGFYLSSNPKDLISPTRTANTGIYVGKIRTLTGRDLMLDREHSLEPGDRIRIVLRDKDVQTAARIHLAGPGGKVTIDRDLDDSLAVHLQGALVFKTDTAAGKDRAWKTTGLSKSDSAGMLEQAEAKARQVIKIVLKGKTGRGRACSEPEIVFFLDDLEPLSRLSPKRRTFRVMVPISRKNLSDACRLFRTRGDRKRLTFHLPPVTFENRLKRLHELVSEARKNGFHRFQISNLAHLGLPLKGCTVTSSYELNILNSQALEQLRHLGVQRPQFSVETDLRNMKDALENTDCSPSLTVFGHLPLFTTRLRHRTFNRKKAVESTKKERFYWQDRGEYGCLYGSVPFSFLPFWNELTEMGIREFIIDLRFSPRRKNIPARFPSTRKALASAFKGRPFNMNGTLE